MLATRWHTHVHRFARQKPSTCLQLFEQLDAFRRPERLEHLLEVCEADVRGRLGFENRAYTQPQAVYTAFEAAAAVDAAALAAQGLKGPKIGAALRQRRMAAIAQTRAA